QNLYDAVDCFATVYEYLHYEVHTRLGGGVRSEPHASYFCAPHVASWLSLVVASAMNTRRYLAAMLRLIPAARSSWPTDMPGRHAARAFFSTKAVCTHRVCAPRMRFSTSGNAAPFLCVVRSAPVSMTVPGQAGTGLDPTVPDWRPTRKAAAVRPSTSRCGLHLWQRVATTIAAQVFRVLA